MNRNGDLSLAQDGEDFEIERLSKGFIEKGYEPTFVEFGAWDGLEFSNCAVLSLRGWSGVFIEGDSRKARVAAANYSTFPAVTVINDLVGLKGNNLREILHSSGLKKFLNPLVLSVDVDGDDLALFVEGEVRPQILVIEYNPLIAEGLKIINPVGKRIGNSKTAIVEVVEQCGYSLEKVTQTNLIFVRTTPPHISIVELELTKLEDFVSYPKSFFFGYDGLLYAAEIWSDEIVRISDNFRIPWSSYIGGQPMPRMLSGFREGTNFIQSVTSLLGALFRTPKEIIGIYKMAHRLRKMSKSDIGIRSRKKEEWKRLSQKQDGLG